MSQCESTAACSGAIITHIFFSIASNTCKLLEWIIITIKIVTQVRLAPVLEYHFFSVDLIQFTIIFIRFFIVVDVAG